MPLIRVDLPTPKQLRGGWAAKAAICAAYGWDDTTYAKEDLWFSHDGGGNWACIRFMGTDQAVLLGHDHEGSETYFRDAARDFGEEETDLLKDAPSWWEEAIETAPYGPYIGFIYGWDGNQWLRSDYEEDDGFSMLGLLASLKVEGGNSLSDAVRDFERPANRQDIEALVNADGEVTEQLLERVMPNYNIKAGAEAAKNFLLAKLD